MKNQDIVLAIKDALLQRLTDKINTIQDERDREVVALRALHGYNFQQIGELLGMSFEVAEARWQKVTQQWANARGQGESPPPQNLPIFQFCVTYTLEGLECHTKLTYFSGI